MFKQRDKKVFTRLTCAEINPSKITKKVDFT